MTHSDWGNPAQSVLGMHLATADDEVLVWFNRHAEAVLAVLPPGEWEVGLLSDDKTVAPFTGSTIFLPPRSVVALTRAQASDDPPDLPPTPSPSPEKEPLGVPPSGPPEQEPPPVEVPPAETPPAPPPSEVPQAPPPSEVPQAPPLEVPPPSSA